MKKISIFTLLCLSIFLFGCQAKPLVLNQPDPYQGWNTFTNSDGGYIFKHPPVWSAAVNHYNNNNTLFGPSATDESGTGGVEVNSYTGTVGAYLDYMEKNVDITYLSREVVAINGLTGIKTKYQSSSASGSAVYLQKDDQIFNIYINSQDASDLALFNNLVDSFKPSN